MKKELYQKRADALHYAELFAEENNGYVDECLSSVSSDNCFDYVERGIPDWSGETPAFQVIGEEYNLIALFGYMDEE